MGQFDGKLCLLIDANQCEIMRGQLSKDVNFRLVTSGDIGPKEITNLIRLLEAQRYVMTEFDVDEPKPMSCEEKLSP